jgi:hypothetical protein
MEIFYDALSPPSVESEKFVVHIREGRIVQFTLGTLAATRLYRLLARYSGGSFQNLSVANLQRPLRCGDLVICLGIVILVALRS